ncbi:hypothetical protein CRV08_09900 [Halarcobacter ebronensis]|uniref:Uncharacterized protein n=1 Tax=Halarcobacter ebronensis TaxID=1462615 RepID=A0A4Q0YDN6_9BACT|nr:hypothetical protein [Halarcobacter ebronensis]RXJ67674.1 hypothetical protein CRV08_09900 [Halarcobacter ebronensis]
MMDKFFDSILNVIIVGVVICSVVVLLFVGKTSYDTYKENKIAEKTKFSKSQEYLMRHAQRNNNNNSNWKYFDKKEGSK